MATADVHHLMHLHQVDDTELLRALRQHLSDSLADPHKDKAEADVFRDYLAWHADENPFSELPEDIKIQLEALKVEIPQASRRLRDLATSLTDLYLKNQRELAKQGRYTFWGFVVGILGLLLAVAFGVLSIPKEKEPNQRPESAPMAVTPPVS